MGRNFLSATQLVHQVIADLQPLASMLPPQDRLVFNRFSEYALNHRTAIANAPSMLPLETMLLIVLLEEHKRNQRLYVELREEIEMLKRAVQRGAGLTGEDDEGP